MKHSLWINLLVAGLVAVGGGAGCKHKSKGLTPIEGQRTGRTGPGTAGPIGPGPGAGIGAPMDTGAKPIDLPKGPEGTIPLANIPLENFNQNREALQPYTVYFEFDRSTVREGERGKLEAVADYFKKAPANNALLVEGHCDERGTEEYNRALGERRALALREYLANLGLGPERVRTLSYGEDRPAIQGHNEAAWSKNRRGEFILLTPK